MSDLISREALKKFAIPCEIHNGALTELCVPLYQIDNAPTVCGNNSKWCENCVSKGKCASTRPQGEWIKISNYHFKCKQCHFDDCAIETKFCPNCGADMRGGKK